MLLLGLLQPKGVFCDRHVDVVRYESDLSYQPKFASAVNTWLKWYSITNLKLIAFVI
ncbi:MAG: hypothetical protein QOE37_2214 [Microbacteriaceae bacterium]|jgi:hypothetical protein|nr:hypothetical protein [Microbacteriaceae bacterium]